MDYQEPTEGALVHVQVPNVACFCSICVSCSLTFARFVAALRMVSRRGPENKVMRKSEAFKTFRVAKLPPSQGFVGEIGGFFGRAEVHFSR